jgi:predicted permease
MATYLRTHSQTTDIASVDFSGRPISLTVDGVSERVIGTLVSANYFGVLGTRAALGRFFVDAEDQVPGQRPVVVLSHDLWVRRLHSDPGVLQHPVRLNNVDFTVVGVAEPGFHGSSMIGTDLWAPMAMVQEMHGRPDANMLTEPRSVWHVAIGRVRSGVSMAQSRAELAALAEAYKQGEPLANRRHTIATAPLGRIPGPVRTPFLAFIGFLFLLTGALLAIACSNVAGMLLARAAGRRREMATRLAVGATRSALMTQLLVETLVLFTIAAAVSLPLTWWLLSLMNASHPALPITVLLHVDMNARVVAFSLGIAWVAGLVFGLAPARHALSAELAPMLHGANSTPDRIRVRLRNVLVAAQVALSLMLVVTATLFLRSLEHAADVDPGFSTANIDIATVDVSMAGYRDQSAVELAGRFMERLRAVSGVESVAVARMIPLQGSGFGLGGVKVPGIAGPGPDGGFDADWDIVSPTYFSTINMPLVDGRAFNDNDRAGSAFVTIINETLAAQIWPGQSAIGRTLLQDMGDNQTRPLQVIGVARDAKYRYISSPRAPYIYVPLAQQPTSEMEIYIRHAPGREIGREVRSAVAQVEPAVPIVMLQSFEDAAALGLLPQKLTAWIAGSVGLVGVALAALGLYGLMAFVVSQRTREIAIRMAMGASIVAVRHMVLRQAAMLGLTGAIVGLGLAAAVAALVQELLVGIAPVDPVSFGGTTLVLLLVLTAAAWMPAQRAAATDPAIALRSE